MPSDERNMDRASDRKHERAEHVENILDETESLVRDDQKFPVRSEELAEEYGDQPIDLPNETESLGSVFDRLDEKFENPAEVREAVYGEVTGEAGGSEEYNEERDLRALDRAEGDDTRNAVEREETAEGAEATFGENGRGPGEDREREDER